MTLRSMLASLLAVSLAAVAAAQGCPRQVAETVPDSVSFQGNQGCGGATFNVGNLTISTGQHGCPLLAIYTPEHEIPRYDPTSETKVLDGGPGGQVLVISFVCDTDYLVFIPLGTSCVIDKVVRGAVLKRLSTAAC